MAFSEETVQRMREFLQQKDVDFYEKKMFGGICFMVDDKLCVCTRIDKSTGEDIMLCRIGEEKAHEAVKSENVRFMDNGGNTFSDFIYVDESAFRTAKGLSKWIELALDFNPVAKASKK